MLRRFSRSVALPALVAVLTGCLAALPALAQSSGQGPRCAPRAQVLDLVETRLSESRRAIGLTSAQTVMELYASDETGSWTLVVTLPSGLSCLVATGRGFEAEGPRPAGAPA